MPFAGRLRSPYQPTFSQGFNQVGSLISNLMIQKIQQNFREKEATIQRDLQMGMAGFQKEAPTTRTSATPSGDKRRVPSEAVQPDIEAGGQEYYYKGFKPRVLGTIQGHHMIETGPGQVSFIKPTEPTVPTAPKTRQVKRGDEVVTEEFDASTGAWTEVGRGKRYKPTTNINFPAQAERERLATGSASLENLKNLQTLFNENFVGPITGRVGKIKDVFGANPQAQSEFYAATAAFKNAIIKEITGAQMSEKEADRIMKQVPDVDDAPSVWRAKWEQSIRNVRVLQKKRLEIMEKSGLTVPELGGAGLNPDDPLGLL